MSVRADRYEKTDGSVELGDVIRGDLETVAGETFYNITKSEEMEVFVEGWGCDLHGAKMMMR